MIGLLLHMSCNTSERHLFYHLTFKKNDLKLLAFSWLCINIRRSQKYIVLQLYIFWLRPVFQLEIQNAVIVSFTNVWKRIYGVISNVAYTCCFLLDILQHDSKPVAIRNDIQGAIALVKNLARHIIKAYWHPLSFYLRIFQFKEDVVKCRWENSKIIYLVCDLLHYSSWVVNLSITIP